MSAIIGFVVGVILDIPASVALEAIYNVFASVIDVALNTPHIGPMEVAIITLAKFVIHALVYLILPGMGISAAALLARGL